MYILFLSLPRTVAPFFLPAVLYTYKYNHIYSPRSQRPWEGWTPTGAGGVRGSAGAAKPHAQGSPPDPRFPTLPGGLRLPCFGGGGTRRGRAQRGGEQDHTLIIYRQALYICPCSPSLHCFFGPSSGIMDMWRSHRTWHIHRGRMQRRSRGGETNARGTSYSSRSSINYQKNNSKYIQ